VNLYKKVIAKGNLFRVDLNSINEVSLTHNAFCEGERVVSCLEPSIGAFDLFTKQTLKKKIYYKYAAKANEFDKNGILAAYSIFKGHIGLRLQMSCVLNQLIFSI